MSFFLHRPGTPLSLSTVRDCYIHKRSDPRPVHPRLESPSPGYGRNSPADTHGVPCRLPETRYSGRPPTTGRTPNHIPDIWALWTGDTRHQYHDNMYICATDFHPPFGARTPRGPWYHSREDMVPGRCDDIGEQATWSICTHSTTGMTKNTSIINQRSVPND